MRRIHPVLKYAAAALLLFGISTALYTILSDPFTTERQVVQKVADKEGEKEDKVSEGKREKSSGGNTGTEDRRTGNEQSPDKEGDEREERKGQKPLLKEKDEETSKQKAEKKANVTELDEEKELEISDLSENKDSLPTLSEPEKAPADKGRSEKEAEKEEKGMAEKRSKLEGMSVSEKSSKKEAPKERSKHHPASDEASLDTSELDSLLERDEHRSVWERTRKLLDDEPRPDAALWYGALSLIGMDREKDARVHLERLAEQEGGYRRRAAEKLEELNNKE